MAARSTITLTDAALTPVNHAYAPTKSVGNDLIYVDRSNPIVVGQNRLTVTQREATRQAPTSKVVYKLETPILEQSSPSTSTGIQPAPKVAYTPRGEISFMLPDRCTLQERKDLLAQMRDLLSEAIVTDTVHNYDWSW